MATTMIAAPYSAQPSAHYGYAAPPSPPMDDTSKCSLPSISNLLGLADQGSPTSETSPQFQQQQQQQQQQAQQQTQQQQQQSQPQQQQQQQPQQQQEQFQQQQQQQPGWRNYRGNDGDFDLTTQSMKPSTRPNSSHYSSAAMSRSTLPPTPPMSSDASFEGYNSPSTKSVSQLSVASGYYFESTPPLGHVESDTRHHLAAATVPRVPVQTSAYQPQFATSAYMTQPTMASYYPPMQPTPPPQPQISGLYYQRPLPQTFPPLPVSVALGPTSGANPWQHHHYISPSSAASFPQSQDRYICQTCNKAFSRPSSLRIHSHSHTGEKPFKCPHAGCGKAFSVRSNMKRHERGCHNFETSSSGSSLIS